MKYYQIVNTGLNVSAICLGTWVFGGEGWSGAKEDESIAAIHAAIDSGINFIDTAPVYGWGVSEQIVGKAIAGKRDKVILATKCGLVKKGKGMAVDLSPQSIKSEIDQSLKRLNVDYVDLYQCHWPDQNTPLEETLATLLEIQKAGKIKHMGVSNFDEKLLEKASQFTTIATLQSQCSILDRTIEKKILPVCRERKIGFLAYGPLGGGILSGKYIQPADFKGNDARSFFYKYYKGDKFNQVQNLLNRLKEYHKPLNQLAINWVRQQPGVVSVLVGCRTAQQVQENAGAASWDLSEKDLGDISSIEI